ncbi:reverse transcriptase domain-containing protein, partial [Tanacetum coccineum]
MAEGDEEKIAFFTKEGVFCYKRLPFYLKNAGATYHKLIDKVFGNQMGSNLKVHFDDMIIKSNSKEDMLANIKETFKKLQAINMKLNPKKCSFEVEERSFLGYPITKQGIKANLSKLHKWKDSPMDNRSIRSLSKHEGVYRGITNGYRPNQRRNFGNVPHSLRGKHQCRDVSRKGKEASPR